MVKFDKNFTEEQALEIWTMQKWRCAGCNKRCGNPKQMYQIHHKKKKSALTKSDIEKHGTAGGARNGVGLCQACHDKTHAGHPDFAKFRTPRWAEIGTTEE